MNDEASSSTAAPLNAEGAVGAAVNDNAVARARDARDDDENESKGRLRRDLLQRLEELLLAFDLVIYAELAALYYMECVLY